MRAAALLLALLLLIGGAGYYFTAIKPIDSMMKKGLDIKGGVRLVLEGRDTPEAKVTREAMEQALKVIEFRVNKLGVSEPNIQLEGANRIIVELAGVENTEQARRDIGTTAQLKFVDPDGNVVLTGQDVADAQAFQNTQSGGFGVSLDLKGEGPKKFAEATAKHLNKQIAILLDDQVISAPVVQSVIDSGKAQITGSFTAEEAQRLANLIKGGALPVKLEIIENRAVSATLGQDSFARSVRAGAVGALLVALFMLLRYRIPGAVAVVALCVYLGLTIASIIALGAVLTLPGIAGIILSVGMAVDANVLIFERIREELRKGSGLRTGIDAGFRNAFSAVIDSNVTTILAALILYWLGTGPVKGFGLTLAIGVAISMFTAITLTRWILKLVVATGWVKRTSFVSEKEVPA